MKRIGNWLPGNGVLAMAAVIALGVGLVAAQDNVVPKTEGTVQQTAPDVNVQTPRAGANVQTPRTDVRTPAGKAGIQGGANAQVPRAGVQGNVNGQGNLGAPGVGRAGVQTGVRGNVNAQPRAGVGFKVNVQGNQGLRVSGLVANGVGARAGFRANDRIVSIDGRRFTTDIQFRAYLASQAGRRVPVIIERDGQQYTIELPLEEQPMEGAWLGVNLDDGENSASVKGARIARIFPSGPAAQAGLQTGDIIVGLNNQPVGSASDVIVSVQEMQPQTQIEVAILRDNTEMKVPVVLGDRSGYLGRFQFQNQFAGAQGNGNQGSNGQQGNGQAGQNFQDNDIPPYAMQMEHERRMAEQHERIEDEIRQLRDEVKKLRELLEQRR